MLFCKLQFVRLGIFKYFTHFDDHILILKKEEKSIGLFLAIIYRLSHIILIFNSIARAPIIIVISIDFFGIVDIVIKFRQTISKHTTIASSLNIVNKWSLFQVDYQDGKQHDQK